MKSSIDRIFFFLLDCHWRWGGSLKIRWRRKGDTVRRAKEAEIGVDGEWVGEGGQEETSGQALAD